MSESSQEWENIGAYFFLGVLIICIIGNLVMCCMRDVEGDDSVEEINIQPSKGVNTVPKAWEGV